MGVRDHGLAGDAILDAESNTTAQGIAGDVLIDAASNTSAQGLAVDVLLNTDLGESQVFGISVDLIIIEKELNPGHVQLHGMDFKRFTGESMKKER